MKSLTRHLGAALAVAAAVLSQSAVFAKQAAPRAVFQLTYLGNDAIVLRHTNIKTEVHPGPNNTHRIWKLEHEKKIGNSNHRFAIHCQKTYSASNAPIGPAAHCRAESSMYGDDKMIFSQHITFKDEVSEKMIPAFKWWHVSGETYRFGCADTGCPMITYSPGVDGQHPKVQVSVLHYD